MQFSKNIYIKPKKAKKMLVFPNCKINLGLQVIEKRKDGFHNIESVFYPVNWCDALEVIEGGSVPFSIEISGLKVIGKQEDNIIFKAWELIKEKCQIPNIRVFLHKTLPMGAGLGGGSSDAAFFLRIMNRKFSLKIDDNELRNLAGKLGSDCSFFIENKPVLAAGKGDVFSVVNLNLKGYYMVIIYPGINSNTAEAYTGITPLIPERSLKDIIENESIDNWRSLLKNDFEKSIFAKYPSIERIKKQLYERGAIYASMSGSGSAVYGIFGKKERFDDISGCTIFQIEL